MTTESVQVPAGFVDRFNAWIDNLVSQTNAAPESTPDPTPVDAAPAVTVDAYEALQTQVAAYEARIATMEAAAARNARVAHFAAELSEAAPVAQDAELHTLLAGLDDETAAPIVQRFKALSAQIDESALTGDIGASGDGTPVDADALIAAYQAENPGVSFTAAVKAVAKANPGLTF